MEDKEGVHMRENKNIDEENRFKIRYDIIAESMEEIEKYLNELLGKN
jgi:hypothetical protein